MPSLPVLVACVLAAAWPGAASAQPAAAPVRTMAPLRLVGRFAVDEGRRVLRAAWPNSAVGLAVDGGSLTFLLAEDPSGFPPDAEVHNVVQVLVDGAPHQRLTLAPGPLRPYALAPAPGPGPHTVWLVKATEAMAGAMHYGGVTLGPDTRLLPPPAATRRIEVYGASNEAGYGSLADVTAAEMCGFDLARSDPTVAYPALLAARLGADLVNIAWSGKGISDGGPGGAGLPTVALRTLPDAPAEWPAAPAADVLLVALGPNDFGRTPPPRATFVAAYADFLQTLRRRNPRAPILCLISPMLHGAARATLTEYVTAAAAAVSPAAQVVPLIPYTGERFGCDFHPNRSLHARLAAQLAPTVAAAAGW